MRVVLESYAVTDPRLFLFAQNSGLDRYTCLGILVELWQFTQELGVSKATEMQISAFFRQIKVKKKTIKGIHIISHLCDAGYLNDLGDKTYEIRGNGKHIAALNSAKEKAKKSAEARWSHAPSNAPSNAQAMLTQTQTQTQTHKKKKNSVASPPCPFFEIWNANCGSLPRCSETASRLPKAKKRLDDNPDPEYWAEIVRRAAASQFCQGNNDRGWRMDIDFLLKPDTHIKIMEGKYGCQSSTDDNWAKLADDPKKGLL